MYNKRHILIFFMSIIGVIYLYGIGHSYYYGHLIENATMINLDKNDFKDTNQSEYTIENRSLNEGESKTKRYKYTLSSEAFQVFDGLSGSLHSDFYIMLEKPDCQYIEVYINDIMLGRSGDIAGDSNLWNGTLFFEFNNSMLKENNKLEIRMISDYMTGVGGNIQILRYEDYRKIEIMTSFSYALINGTIIITLFVSFLLLLVMVAWHKQLYNMKVYGYFLISVFFLGIGLIDYKESHFLLTSYYLFKSVMLISYHLAITFATLAVAHLLNIKHKFNIGMIGSFAIFMAILISNNMIQFRAFYTNLNYFLIFTAIQLIYMLFKYRSRAPLTVTVMLYGFTLCLVSIVRLVIITQTSYAGTTLIDLPLLIIVYVVMIMFVVYIELLQMVGDHGFMPSSNNETSKAINMRQGYFVLNRQLTVMGVYSTACDHIFKKRITGLHISNFMFSELDEKEQSFVEETLLEVFNPDVDFKDGFISLLPERVLVGEHIYEVAYAPVERADLFLRVTLNDITKSVLLGKELEEQGKFYKFIINAMKFRQETTYFIEKTKNFIMDIKAQGFNENNVMALHTLKGNLGQLGFYKFEKEVHKIESAIELGNYDQDSLIKSLEYSFYESIEVLNDYIGDGYFEMGYNQVVVSLEELIALENTYSAKTKKEHFSNEFFSHLKAIKYVNLTEMLKRYVEYLPRIAMENEKGLLPFNIEGQDIRVLGNDAEELVRVLVAVFRNAVVHGIELPEERVLMGKDSYGTIKCKTSLMDNVITIEIEDDGRGIDLEKVMSKALKENIVNEDQVKSMSRSEQIDLIFKANMSQKEDVDLYAGRGIGLSAVYLTVQALHGTIIVETIKGKGTKMKINVPYSSLID